MEAAPTRPRPSRRTLTLIVTPILAVIVVGWVGQAFFPALLRDHPLLLVALEPRGRNLLLVAGREGGIDFWPFLTIAAIRKLVSDPLFYLLGYFYGDGAVRWVEEKMGDGGRVVRGIERAFAKAGPVMVFLFPGALVCALAGATGMNLTLFFILNIAGTVAMVSLYYYVAGVSWIEAPLESLTGFITGNARWLTVISIVLTVVWVATQQRRSPEIESVDEIERELTSDDDN